MKVRTAVYARMLTCTSRSIVRLIDRGLPAKRKGTSWELDVAKADAWIEKHAPRVWSRTNRGSKRGSPRKGRTSAARPGRRRRAGSSPPADVGGNGSAHTEDGRLRRLDAVLEKFIDQLDGEEVNLDARVVSAIKSISTELRMLDRHRREMLEADHRLMPREEARRQLATIGRIVAEEIEAFIPTSPDILLAALTRGGVKLRNPAKGLKLLTVAAKRISDQLRERIADSIEATEF